MTAKDAASGLEKGPTSKDSELYDRFLDGDVSSYDQLMIRYGDRLTFYIYGYTNDLQDAEDLMIEAFARIMVKKPRIRSGYFKTYLYKAARNLAARFHEKRSRLQTFDFEDIREEIADSVLTEDILADRERNEVLHMCLDRIDPRMKEVLWLFYFEDLSYEQIADVMKMRKKQVDHLLENGKKQMKEELKKEGIANAQ
ncbi:MAG: sigma-70 family RNA polymerase sigma factor [Erysipelotrichaceae bacterium]|nr:sigma-70 family RNA polymerase sigma factor [Erysipelotrichaceae bacterium]